MKIQSKKNTVLDHDVVDEEEEIKYFDEKSHRDELGAGQVFRLSVFYPDKLRQGIPDNSSKTR